MPEYSADQNAILPYLSDESSAFSGHADRVYFPESAAEVAGVLRAAADAEVPVSVSGGGTSITGARVPVSGGWILATDRLTSVTEPTTPGDWKRINTSDGCFYLDAKSMCARVPAGIRLSELDTLIAPHGLYYPPTLTETSAMVGGTIATNASGARSYHYGATRVWVEALTVVMPGGEVLSMRRGDHVAENGLLRISDDLPAVRLPDLPDLRGIKNAAGYFVGPDVDAVDLFIGGEGTLAVVAEAEIRFAPRASDAVTLFYFFAERDTALDFADAIRDGFYSPWTALAVEYFDGESLNFMRESYSEVPGAAAAILVEIARLAEPGEGEPPPGGLWYNEEGSVRAWIDSALPFAPVDAWAVLPTEREEIRLFRHSLPDRVNDYVRTREGKLGTDLAVPPDHFRALMREYDCTAAGGVRTVLFGHLGEYHLHLNFLADDEAQMERARGLYTELARAAVELGGTVSAEHGVGKKRIWSRPGRTMPYLELMYGPDGMEKMRDLKNQLDPGWILNPETLMLRETRS